MSREQWRAVWRMMRIEKRELAAKARRESEERRAKLREGGMSDEYEIRIVCYPGYRSA